MAFTAADVMLRAQYILQDAGSVRWTPPELRLWLNDAMREIAVHKPNATARSVEMALQKGTYQVLPDEYQTLLKITRNLATTDASSDRRGGGRAITPITRDIMDQQIPGWQDDAVMPYAKQVVHYIDEIINPRSFYVVPGNDGTGLVEAVVSRIPTEIPEPPAPGNLDAAGYTSTVDLPDAYRSAVVDYMLYRAFSKDSQVPNGFQRAAAHYQQFATALGLKAQGEAGARMAAGKEA
jgi:hypothetical protein